MSADPTTPPEPCISFIAGLDLGQTKDYTALTVLQRSDDGKNTSYECRVLHRFPLTTPYTEIAKKVAEIVNRPPLPGCTLAVDETGLGRPVVELLRQMRMPVSITPVTITSGNSATRTEDGSYHVPKKELISATQILFQSGRLRIARGMKYTEVLEKELLNFRVKISLAANETYSAWRESDHDDLVLSLCLAAWAGENATVRFGPPTEPERGIEDQMRSAQLGLMDAPKEGWMSAKF